MARPHGWAVTVLPYENNRPEGDPVLLATAPSNAAARRFRKVYVEQWARQRGGETDRPGYHFFPDAGPDGVWLLEYDPTATVHDRAHLIVAGLVRIEDRRDRKLKPKYAVEFQKQVVVKVPTRKEALRELTREVERWRSTRYPKRQAIKNPVLPDTYDLRWRGTWVGVARIIPLTGGRR